MSADATSTKGASPRVLVMICQPSGESEVYDFGALIEEACKQADKKSGGLSLRVKYSGYSWDTEQPIKVEYQSDINEWSPSGPSLEAAINFALGDSVTVENLRKRASKLRKKADQIEYEAKVFKLQELAAIGSLLPIKVTPVQDSSSAMLANAGGVP